MQRLGPHHHEERGRLRFIFNPTWFQVYPVLTSRCRSVSGELLRKLLGVQLFNGGAVHGGDATTGLNVHFAPFGKAA